MELETGLDLSPIDPIEPVEPRKNELKIEGLIDSLFDRVEDIEDDNQED